MWVCEWMKVCWRMLFVPEARRNTTCVWERLCARLHRLDSICLDVHMQVCLPQPSQVKSVPCFFTSHHISPDSTHHRQSQAVNVQFYGILENLTFVWFSCDSQQRLSWVLIKKIWKICWINWIIFVPPGSCLFLVHLVILRNLLMIENHRM